VRWKYWRNRCARQCLPPPLFVTQKGCRSEFQTPPIKSFTSIICREIQIAKIWIYYLVLHHCKTQRFLKPFTAHTSDLLELTSLSNKFDGHNQGKPDNFPHFCSRAKTTVFQTHTSDLHRFCSNRLVRRTKTQSVEPLRFKQLIRDP
jgi:hypothetical protein